MSINVEKCLQAWTNSFKQMNARADIVFYGDSLTYYGDFSLLFPSEVVCNLGLRGDTLQGLIDRVEQVRILNPKKVYLMAGINDIVTNTCSQFEDKYEKLISSISYSIPSAVLILQSILPVNDYAFHISCNNSQIAECNSIISRVAKRHELMFLNLNAQFITNGVLPAYLTVDGIHLLPQAYEKWYNIIIGNKG